MGHLVRYIVNIEYGKDFENVYLTARYKIKTFYKITKFELQNLSQGKQANIFFMAISGNSWYFFQILCVYKICL